VEHVHQIGVSECSPEGLALHVPRGDLNLDARDAAISHPIHRFVDETSGDALAAQFGTDAEVGDLRAFDLLHDRRRVIDANDHDPVDLGPIWVRLICGVKDKDLGVRIPGERAQQLAQFALCHVAAPHPKERIEPGVVFGDQRPERGHPVDLLHPRRTDPARSLRRF